MYIEKFSNSEIKIHLFKEKEPTKCLFLDQNNNVGFMNCSGIEKIGYKMFVYNTKFNTIMNFGTQKYMTKNKNGTLSWTNKMEDAQQFTFTNNNRLILIDNRSKAAKTYLCAEPLIFSRYYDNHGGAIKKLILS